MAYSAPSITDLGSVAEITLDFNKRGKKPDMYSKTVPVVGSLGPVI